MVNTDSVTKLIQKLNEETSQGWEFVEQLSNGNFLVRREIKGELLNENS